MSRTETRVWTATSVSLTAVTTSTMLALPAAMPCASPSATGAFATERPGKYDVRPAGNAVNLEDEMMKVASNQMDHQAAISLYSRSMGLIKTALGK